MIRRVHVQLDDAELRQIQRLAKGRRMTTAAWVRASLRASVEAETRAGLPAKLEAIRRAATFEFPTGEINQLLAEIERGYAGHGEG